MKKTAVLTHALCITMLMISLVYFESNAYEVVGKGYIQPDEVSTFNGRQSTEVTGVDASTLTLQQIEDSKGNWAWIDTDGDGLAERYYLLNSHSYLTNGITPDGLTVNASGQWTVDGKIQYRQGNDTNAVSLAMLRAKELHGNSYTGIYAGTVQFKGDKKKSYGIEVTEDTNASLTVTIGDDSWATSSKYEYSGLSEAHPGVTIWKSNGKRTDEDLLFYGYDAIVFYNYDGSIAGQLTKIG
ncbi:hypothetical protein [Oribacterium sp. WCC10]|uniref:hypothetical protein n=1 Tax=Oribacterium sp. WCC10 TaxID=1855343 RepID=UPI0008DFA10F|nr:hypothetical protein [Oribacterium sp. WCC10]SFG54209.1 hypothetical protein SAMN05216356_11264 [Oribacterium sp. WCC10]